MSMTQATRKPRTRTARTARTAKKPAERPMPMVSVSTDKLTLNPTNGLYYLNNLPYTGNAVIKLPDFMHVVSVVCPFENGVLHGQIFGRDGGRNAVFKGVARNGRLRIITLYQNDKGWDWFCVDYTQGQPKSRLLQEVNEEYKDMARRIHKDWCKTLPAIRGFEKREIEHVG